MQQRSVLLLFGGESSEHDVSISSARNVYDAIDSSRYKVILGYITRLGEWFYTDSIVEASEHPKLQFSINLATGVFTTVSGMEFRPDVILPILHGKNGEDGALQGLAQLTHIPIVGCEMTASVLAMDKIASKALFKEAGLDTLPYIVHRAHESLPDYATIKAKLGAVVFVKPSRAGSSVGVSKVKNAEEFASAIKLAAQHDSLILIEQAANAPREIEVAILGNALDRKASIPGEIQPDRDFYSYESKYDNTSQTKLLLPAQLSESAQADVREKALVAYDALHCEGLARVDFLLDTNGNMYINEINTIPGFTDSSMYPKLWQESGVSYADLIDKLLQLAILRAA